ncbi:sensor histidine kinase [Amycolatopsis taiwanensis]|uniref:histidine kinase n=1 Tax=Amycolatopsis taiwanensis TaxID=342230 RepID=A0A9W6R7K5_9PSEU|nr:sensor histidine kinase [Amycolatopsis taiwanensis]GLY70576.1 two-component sensor histidine kinase [Amycolatopsis taiwanensis]
MRTADRAWSLSLREFGFASVLAGVLVFGTIGAGALQTPRARALDFWAFLLVVLAAVTTVALRRRAPVWGLTVAMAVLGVYLLAGYPYGPIQLCMIIAMFEVARQRSLRLSLLACGLAAGAAYAMVAARFSHHLDTPVVLSVAWLGWVVLPWSLGALVHAVTAARERARQELVERVALEERMRIASDVHDIAGHGFALVAMQAGVALLVFDEQPEQARESLEAIQATSAKSLTELRSMLGTFHPDGQGEQDPAKPDEDTADSSDDPDCTGDTGLAGLPELVDQVRAGGLPVELHLQPLATPLADDIDVVAYRVVQESLTNVLRHAGETTADVRIAQQEGELVVQVADHGRATPQQTPRLGRGLTGMRGRVEDVGGTLEAGPREGGGFRVVAHLPLTGYDQ